MSLRALSHGWELRLTVGSELIHSQVVRSPNSQTCRISGRPPGLRSHDQASCIRCACPVPARISRFVLQPNHSWSAYDTTTVRRPSANPRD
jgi:hypothetical protein